MILLAASSLHVPHLLVRIDHIMSDAAQFAGYESAADFRFSKPACDGAAIFAGNAVVKRVIDGDTVVLDDSYRVRYLGIDTPERGEPLYEEATELNRQLVEGRQVTLLATDSNTGDFGRLLRYVVVDDVHVNAELVRAGLAEQTVEALSCP